MPEEEKLDVLNKDGGEKGKIKQRGRVHDQGDWHRSVHVWIVDSDGEILIQRRSADSRISPGFWTVSASGHVESGDEPIITAIKEVKEELGVSLGEKDLEYLTTYKKSKHYEDRGIQDNEFNPIFVVRKEIEENKLSIDEEEVEEVKRIYWKDLKRMIEEEEIKFRPDREKYHRIMFEYFSKEF